MFPWNHGHLYGVKSSKGRLKIGVLQSTALGALEATPLKPEFIVITTEIHVLLNPVTTTIVVLQDLTGLICKEWIKFNHQFSFTSPKSSDPLLKIIPLDRSKTRMFPMSLPLITSTKTQSYFSIQQFHLIVCTRLAKSKTVHLTLPTKKCLTHQLYHIVFLLREKMHFSLCKVVQSKG